MPEPAEALSATVVERVLERFDGGDPPALDPLWREEFIPGEPVRGLLERAFDTLAARSGASSGALHGWIDQAVLEIVAIASLPQLRERALSYRPDQGGDMGVLTASKDGWLLLSISFQGGSAGLYEFTSEAADA